MFASVLDRLSSIGGKRLLVGAYLPVLLFCAAITTSVYLFAGSAPLLKRWEALGGLQPIAGVVFFLATIAFAYTLLIMTPVLSATAQGANWPDWLRRPLLHRQLVKRRALSSARDAALRELRLWRDRHKVAIAEMERFRDLPASPAPTGNASLRVTVLESEIERLAILVAEEHAAATWRSWLELRELALLHEIDGERRGRLVERLASQFDQAQVDAQLRYAAASGDLDRRFGNERSRRRLAPTALGAVFLAADGYAEERYGMDGVALWPRLEKVISEDFRSRLEDARIAYAFALGVFWLVLLYGMCWSGFVVWRAALEAWQPTSGRWLWLVPSALAVVVAWPLYRVALAAAESYCALHQSCFDLFRFDLLKVLRFKSPTLPDEERALWLEIGRVVAYGQRSSAPRYYAHPPEK